MVADDIPAGVAGMVADAIPAGVAGMVADDIPAGVTGTVADDIPAGVTGAVADDIHGGVTGVVADDIPAGFVGVVATFKFCPYRFDLDLVCLVQLIVQPLVSFFDLFVQSFMRIYFVALQTEEIAPEFSWILEQHSTALSRRHQQGRTEEVRKEEAEDYVEEPYEEVEDYMEEEEEGEHEENGSPGRGRYYGETQSSHRDDRAHPGLNRSKQDSRAAEEEEEEEEQEERQHEGDEDMGEEEEEEEEEGGQSPVNFRSTLAALRGELNISATALHPPRPPPRTQPLREAPPQMPPSHRGSLRDLPGQLSHVSAGISEFAEEVTPVHEHDVRHALQVAHASSDAARNYARGPAGVGGWRELWQAMQGINQEAGAGHGAVRRGSPAKSTPLKLTPSVSGGPSPPGSAVSAASNRSAHISEEELAMPYAERRRARDGEGSAAGSASGSPAPSPRLQPRSPSGVSGSPALSPRLQPRSNGAVVPAGLEGGAAVGPLAPRGSPDALVQLRAENRLLQEELKQAQLASAGAEADRMELEQQLQTMRRLQARPVTHEALAAQAGLVGTDSPSRASGDRQPKPGWWGQAAKAGLMKQELAAARTGTAEVESRLEASEADVKEAHTILTKLSVEHKNTRLKLQEMEAEQDTWRMQQEETHARQTLQQELEMEKELAAERLQSVELAEAAAVASLEHRLKSSHMAEAAAVAQREVAEKQVAAVKVGDAARLAEAAAKAEEAHAEQLASLQAHVAMLAQQQSCDSGERHALEAEVRSLHEELAQVHRSEAHVAADNVAASMALSVQAESTERMHSELAESRAQARVASGQALLKGEQLWRMEQQMARAESRCLELDVRLEAAEAAQQTTSSKERVLSGQLARANINAKRLEEEATRLQERHGEAESALAAAPASRVAVQLEETERHAATLLDEVERLTMDCDEAERRLSHERDLQSHGRNLAAKEYRQLTRRCEDAEAECARLRETAHENEATVASRQLPAPALLGGAQEMHDVKNLETQLQRQRSLSQRLKAQAQMEETATAAARAEHRTGQGSGGGDSGDGDGSAGVLDEFLWGIEYEEERRGEQSAEVAGVRRELAVAQMALK
eukprot:gene8704-10325_t